MCANFRAMIRPVRFASTWPLGGTSHGFQLEDQELGLFPMARTSTLTRHDGQEPSRVKDPFLVNWKSDAVAVSGFHHDHLDVRLTANDGSVMSPCYEL